jgi:hypothetical protein
MKAISLLAMGAAIIFISHPSNGVATTTKDLKLNCGGAYRVLTSVPFYEKHALRLGGYTTGLNETVQVTVVQGADCAKLEPGYQIDLKVGQLHKIQSYVNGVNGFSDLTGGQLSYSQLAPIAKARIGQQFPFQVQQVFGLVNNQTQLLPLFPLLHSETVFALSLQGQANAQKLYGTPGVLNDQQNLLLMDKIAQILVYEPQAYADYQFYGALFGLTPKSLPAYQEYTNTLLDLFEKNTRETTKLYNYSSNAVLGKKLNAVIQLSGGTKFKTQLQILQEQPLLLSEDIIADLFGEPSAAPALSAPAIEAFLGFALEKGIALKVVGNQVWEAQALFYQYKIAGQSIVKYSKPFVNGPVKHVAVFALTQKSVQLLQALSAL